MLILRGCSGCGKSTFAEFLQTLVPTAVVCSADSFMYEQGVYKFSHKKLGYCHISCMHKYKNALELGTEVVIVDNTNTKAKDYTFYEDLAHEKGYMVFCLIVENAHNGKDIHNVPEATLQGQAANILNSLRLLPSGAA